tara:strand:+ start:4248 stop:4460 length:213 start_codon:yes stop_codon:yes gene_type:complete
MDILTNLSTVSRDSGFYIVDFESVEFDLEPSAKVFGPFLTLEASARFAKYLESGYSAESGMLFTIEEDAD